MEVPFGHNEKFSELIKNKGTLGNFSNFPMPSLGPINGSRGPRGESVKVLTKEDFCF